MSDLATRIRIARHAKGMSQSQLARAVGVSIKTVQHWESGLYVPGAEAAGPAGRVLGLALGGNAEQKTQRRCLCCAQPFASTWIGNRICTRCQESAGSVAVTEYRVVA